MIIAESAPGDPYPLAGRRRLSRDVAVHPFNRLRSRERQAPGQHFVERHPKGVKIAPGIDRTIHSSGLFWRHVGSVPATTRAVRAN